MKLLRALVAVFLALGALVGAGAPVHADGRPVALVYRGPASCEGCAEAVAQQLRRSKFHFVVRYVGPNELLKLVPSSFVGVTLYAQPGGDLSVAEADRAIGDEGKRTIKDFVYNGGVYLGFCEGAYLAGSDPGTSMLAPGDTRQYINSPGSTVHNTRDSTVRIRWGKHSRVVFFQDGPYIIPSGEPGERILARYTNNTVAALVKPYGAGWIGVVGPHPEADRSWFTPKLWRQAGEHVSFGLAQQLIKQTMRRR